MQSDLLYLSVKCEVIFDPSGAHLIFDTDPRQHQGRDLAVKKLGEADAQECGGIVQPEDVLSCRGQRDVL